MHGPLKGPSSPTSPGSALSTKKKIHYDHARTTKRPETERIRNMRTQSRSPVAGSPNNSSRTSRGTAADKTIQSAKEKAHFNGMNNREHMGSNDTMVSYSSHTNTSAMSASAILDKRRPLQQDADGNIHRRVSIVNENAINDILGITSGQSLKMKNGIRPKRSNNRKTASSASPVSRRQSNQRRLPANHHVMDSSDEEESYNDKTPRSRKPRASKFSDRGGAKPNVREVRNSTRRSGNTARKSQSLSPARSLDGRGRIRETRRPRRESMSSLSGSGGSDDFETDNSRSRRWQHPNFNQSDLTDAALKSHKSPSLSPHLRVASRMFQNNSDLNEHYDVPFLSPSATRGTVSPLSSPSHHKELDEISPLTTSTKSFLNGPIRMKIPWAQEADMGGAKKEPRKLLSGGEEEDGGGAEAEAEDSFEMNLGNEASYEFGQLEVDKSPIRPDRLSSIRSLSYRERHLRSSYPHELEMYKGRSRNDPDYMPSPPTRSRASARSSTSSYALSSARGSSGFLSRTSTLENSYAHELDMYKSSECENELMSPPSLDNTPTRPTRLASMNLHQSSGSFSIDTFDTIKDGELISAAANDVESKQKAWKQNISKKSMKDDETPTRPTRLASISDVKLHQSLGSFSIDTFDTLNDGELTSAADNDVESNQKPSLKQKKSKKSTKDDEAPAEMDEIESLESSIESFRSQSPPSKGTSKESKPVLQAPHTVGATAKKSTVFLSSLAKIKMPKSPGSLRTTRTFGRKKDDTKEIYGEKQKSWLPPLGGKAGAKLDISEKTDGSKGSKRSKHKDKSERSDTSSKRSGRTKEFASKERLARDQSPSALSGIKQAFHNRKARSMSPKGLKAASKKLTGKAKRKNKQQNTDDS